ncbi:aldo/keto reductase [uncultured Dialister sp.]|uniref:aldo/keto reductase n=1 Tax=uncultured Dialister sp. TaxID=278064 RepID=UPI0026737003|nr:aldo/keto reductase [uncultured Dialister sp.]
MKKRKIGNLTVSEIGMGCMGFSHGYGKVPETSYSIAAIRAAHDYGCTFFDTAETYGREQFYRATTKKSSAALSKDSGRTSSLRRSSIFPQRNTIQKGTSTTSFSAT